MTYQPLYKLINESFHYWEVWEEEDHCTIHWGVIGEKGEVKAIDSIFGEPHQVVYMMIEDKVDNGYETMDFECILAVTYPVDSNYDDPLDKGEKLENWLADFMKWRALGVTAGHTVNENKLEVICYVVNYSIAREVIAAGLEESGFGMGGEILRREIEEEEAGDSDGDD